MPQRLTWHTAAAIAAMLCLSTAYCTAQDAGSSGSALSEKELRLTWKAFKSLHAAGPYMDRLSAAQTALEALTSQGASEKALKTARKVVTALTFDADIWDIRSALKSAKRLLSKHDPAAAASLNWEQAYAYVHDLAYEYDAAARLALSDKLAPLVQLIADRLQALLPPFFAYDVPNDAGKEITVGWRPRHDVKGFVVSRIDLSDPDFESEQDQELWEDLKAELGPTAMALDSEQNPVIYGHRYKYRLYGVSEDGTRTLLAATPAVKAIGSLFDTGRIWFLMITVLFCSAVLYYIQLAGRGKKLNIRKIAGLEAVDEAVGRATEMGRPILFVPGIQDMNDIQTVAGMAILSHVAQTAAEHDAELEVPTARSLVMTVARETVAASYLNAGRPDAYDEKKIYYVTDEQFGYVAAVTGTMVRTKPATCIYMGAFYAESLILAETANITGSIQIAGTAMPAQLPFFVAACDYTLIGEEFFAASAYLSGEPKQLGSLKGQDVGKIFALVLLVFGAGLTIAVAFTGAWRTGLDDLLQWIMDSFLNTSGI